MIPPAETFQGTYPFTPHFSEAARFRLHYLDEGPHDARECLLLLHGEPSWSYLFREIIPPLAAHHRVIAPDYMGFGKSGTPQDRDYSPLAHLENLEAFVAELSLSNITLVMHDWGGAIGGAFALRHPEKIARLIVTNSLLGFGLPGEASQMSVVLQSEYFEWMRRLYREGSFDTVLGEFGAVVLAVMKGLQGVARNTDETWRQAYSLPFATPAECKGAIAFPKSVVSGQPSGLPAPDLNAVAALRQKPATLLVGMQDRVLSPHALIEIFREQYPEAPVHQLAAAGHFLYEDAPETIAALISQFVHLTPCSK